MDLEELLSRPSHAAIEALATLEGDLVVLGAGGKMGPSLARMVRRGLDEAGSDRTVLAVSRFTQPVVRDGLEAASVRTVACDLLEPGSITGLPDAGAVLFMAGRKFGTEGAESTTWALNAWLPGLVGERYPGVPTVVFSSGNIYPFVPVDSGGATEETIPVPVGEYAQSVLARERVFEHFSRTTGTPTTIFRLNYAAELRYGVPLDIGLKVWRELPIDLSMGYFNVIWQGDANAAALASISHATSPPCVLNCTGPETVSVRKLANRFGELLAKEPIFVGQEEEMALLSDATRARELFGPPTVSLEQLTQWIAEWILAGGTTLQAPTHYETRDGSF